jgi:hypothetical protein
MATLAICVVLTARKKARQTQGRLETDANTDHPERGVGNPVGGKRLESGLEVVEADRAFEPAIPATATQATAAEPPAQDLVSPSQQTPTSDALPPQGVMAVRQEYERVVQRRTRLQELMRLEEEEDTLMRQLHASSSQATGPPLMELPSAGTTAPTELPP